MGRKAAEHRLGSALARGMEMGELRVLHVPTRQDFLGQRAIAVLNGASPNLLMDFKSPASRMSSQS
jgi:hypothetical protein